MSLEESQGHTFEPEADAGGMGRFAIGSLDPEGLATALTRLLNDEPEFPRALPVAPRGAYMSANTDYPWNS